MNSQRLMLRCVFLAAKMLFVWLVFMGALSIFALPAKAEVPVWVKHFDSCTQYEQSLEKTLVGLFAQKQLSERATQMQDIIKAREDVNKLVATVYNELRTQQVALNFGELRDILPSLGIVVTDDNTDEICKASYEVKASVGGKQQCVAVAQEARFITNQDDYIYEEGRRRAMDGLFCYLGEWRHFPIANINDPANCEALGLGSSCSIISVWETLGQKIFGDKNAYSDADGTKTPDVINDDQHVHNLCEGLLALGKKCSQDMLRDYIKYSTIDKITRKDRTIILAPPQTWYTPDRCRIIDSTLPVANQPVIKVGTDTPYTKSIKSLEIVDPKKLNSTQFLDYYFGSKFGNPTITKPPANMTAAEYSIEKELQAINVPENNFSGLASKTEQLANQIVAELTELRKLQYTSGEGLRDATLRIGWRDYEWKGNGTYLGKYPALDLPLENPKKPNKIYKPLPCYWEENTGINTGGPIRCEDLALKKGIRPDAAPVGKYFYFDTGLVIAPISVTKDKMQSAIQAQFDLAAKAFDDKQSQIFQGSCGASADGSIGDFLPAPWEDSAVDLSQALNPLTGQTYTTGAPGPNNPSFRIPDLPNNYFNIFYNDVFQLYHTPFPDVLAHWFRVNDPAYDSIYGLGEPPDITAIFQGQGPGGKGPHGPPPPPGPTGPLPTGCNNYDFSGQVVDKCLLKAIAAAESSCNPNAVSSHGACGLMQLLPSTASALAGRTVTCQELQSNPKLSIQLAAQYLQRSSGIITGYSSKGFNIGLDDLIASYNAGYGDKCGSPKQPFCPSSDCPNPPTPSWQCKTNPGGFSETQTYVQRVQNYIAQCQAGAANT